MGRKQSVKLLKKASKKFGSEATGLKISSKKKKGGRKNAVLKSNQEKPRIETLIGRQAQAIKKRKRQDKPAEDDDKKPKELPFDAEAGKAVNGVSKKKVVKTDMSIDQFLAGGFKDVKDDDSNSDSSSDSDSASDDDASSKNNNDAKQQEVEEEEDASSSASTSDDELELHKKELEELKHKDPQLYEHLQKESKELLDFGNSDAEDEDDDENDAEEEAQRELEQQEEDQKEVYTLSMYKALEKEVFTNHSAKGLKTMIQLFHLATRNDLKDEDDEETAAKKYKLENEMVRERALLKPLKKLGPAIDAILGLKKGKSPKSCSKWAKMEKLVTRYLSDLVRAIKTSKDPSMRRDLLNGANSVGHYFAVVSTKVARKYQKILVTLWGSPVTKKPLQLATFANLLQLAKLRRSILAKLLKSTYLEFVRAASSSSKQELERTSMQARCLVQLFGLDLSISYQLAFVYIRQLALHLRAAIIAKTEDSRNSVYSWKFVHCLRLWTVVIAAYPGSTVADDRKANLTTSEQQLRSLIYPLVQIIIGTIQLVPSSRFWPIRFHCIAMLNSLASASRQYIPVANMLIDVLNAGEFESGRPVPSTAKQPELDTLLRLSKDSAKTLPFQQVVVTRTLELLSANLEINKSSIAFPEVVYPITLGLKQFAKRTRVPAWRTDIRKLLGQVENWKAQVKTKRGGEKIGPGSVKRLHHFITKEEELDLVEENGNVSAEVEEEEEEVEEEEEEAVKQPKRKKRKGEVENSGVEDIVEDMEMSSSDSE